MEYFLSSFLNNSMLSLRKTTNRCKMQIAYKQLNKNWRTLEEVVGDDFVVDEGVKYTIESRCNHVILLCEQNEQPTTKCGERINKKDIVSVGNTFYLKAENNCFVNISCDNTQDKKPTPCKQYLNNIIKVGDTRYKCIGNSTRQTLSLSKINGEYINSIDVTDNVFANKVNYVSGRYKFVCVNAEYGYATSEVYENGFIYFLSRNPTLDSFGKFYWSAKPYNSENTFTCYTFHEYVSNGEGVFYTNDEQFSTIKEYHPDVITWELNGVEANPADYSITYSGGVIVADEIIIDFQAAEITSYEWSEL